MGMLDNLGGVEIKTKRRTRTEFTEPGRFVLQVTKVEEFETLSQAELNKKMANPEDHETNTRLSFTVLDILEHDEVTRGRENAVVRQRGVAENPAPGSEPEFVLWFDKNPKYKFSAEAMVKFLIAAKRLTEKEANTLGEPGLVAGWVENGELEGAIVQIDFVSSKDGNFINFHDCQAVDKRKLSKVAKAHMLPF